MKEKRLLYIGNKALKGKPVTTIDTLSALLLAEGYDVRTASSASNKFVRFFEMMVAVLRYANKDTTVLIDTYSTVNFHYATSAAFLCRILGAPYIPILHGGNLPERLRSSARTSRKLFGKAKINVAPSKYMFDIFSAEGFTNVVYIPNSIEIDEYTFEPSEVIGAKLFWVRSFSKIYNPKLAIQTASILKQKGLQVSLCMVGPDKDGSMAECKNLAKKKNIEVRFTGLLSKNEWKQLAKEYDIFINTTNYDNMPVSVIEAMALGMPVVSTNVGGIPYLITDAENGLLVPPKDAEHFAERIIELINNVDLGKKIIQNGRETAEEFAWERVKNLWINVIE